MSSWDVKSCDVLSQPFDLTHIAIEDQVELLDLELILLGLILKKKRKSELKTINWAQQNSTSVKCNDMVSYKNEF